MTKYIIDEEELKEFIKYERKAYCDYLDDKYGAGYSSDNYIFREMSDEEILREIWNRFEDLDDYIQSQN